METEFERCAYRHCKNEFTPHGDRRFCSERCQQAAAYGRAGGLQRGHARSA
jgi:hypothetical protein